MQLQCVTTINLVENIDENEQMSFIMNGIHSWLTTKLLLQLYFQLYT
jgi:hypothetical protein